MEWIFNQLRERPELAIFLTIFLGFWLGKLRIGKFSLGTVTSVLLVGVMVGQLNIAVPGPIKSVFFLLFLFAVGYKVGPQFFRGLKKDGLPQVAFAVLMCISVLGVTWLLALLMGYNMGEAAGLLAGSQTISAVIGVAEDTMANMGLDEAQRQSYTNIIPVSYAVTYIFGTAGSAWVLSSIGPKMLGGLDKVKAACKDMEARMGNSQADEPGFIHAARPVTFRAYRIENEWFKNGKRVIDLEVYFQQQDKRLFVERIRKAGTIREVSPNVQLEIGDEVVLSGRREYVIGEEDWIGPEILDQQLLDFPAEKLPVMITKKTFAGKTVSAIRNEKFMHGVSIRNIKRAGIDIPVMAQTIVDAGDVVEIVGTKQEVEAAARRLGYIDRPGVKKADAEKRARELLEVVGLPDKANAYPAQLSGGQKQRIAIARALATDPKVLLCDEATSALDPNTTHAILTLIKDINKKLGITVVVITHQMSVVEEICDHVAILDGGVVVEEGSVQEIFSNPKTPAAKRLVAPNGGSAARDLSSFAPDDHVVRVTFNGSSTEKPLVASLAAEKGILVSVLSADTRDLSGQCYGSMLLKLPADVEQAKQAAVYMRAQPGITVEEVTGE